MALVTTEQVVNTKRGFENLPLARQLALMIGIAASIAMVAAAVLWAWQPSYKMLYSNLAEQDAAEIVAALDKAGIPYELARGGGTIMVAGDQVHEARLHLAGEGLPKGVGSGFELLESQPGFGVSQFMENARYQRALEGELSRTIASINTVRSARVHLAIPKQTAFVRTQKKPSASVMVDLYAGRGLTPEQAAAIGHLVAASIPNLEVDQITIIDQQGHLLTAPEAGADMRLTATQFEHRKRLEEYYIKRIEDLLSPIAGHGAVKAQVTADVDFTVTEQTQESFNPDLPAIRSEQTVEERMNGAQAAAGVPGSLSNQAPQTGGAEPVESAGSTTRRATRNYELDRTVSHTRRGGGTIRRLSAAVVVDDRAETDEDGATVRTPLSEEQLGRMVDLVKEAIGFDARRGDSVNVINASFSIPPEPEALPEPSIFEAGTLWGGAKQLLGLGAVAFLIFGVLRPVLRELAAKGHALPRAPEPLAEDQLMLSGQRGALLPRAGGSYENNLSAARALAVQDPKRVAQLVNNWVGSE